MDRAKRFTNFFHNFVVMKKSVNFLPEKKQADLKQLVGLVREHVKNVGMVILYGSYARNTYVDYDQRIEFGVPTYFMSDYDILILTRKPIGAIEYSLYDKIADAFFQHKNRPFHTKPQFINYGIADFNYALSKAHYFETEIKRQGIILYDSGEYKLARRRKLNFDEIQERAQKYYDDNFKPKAIEFILLNIDSYNRKNYKMASFNLHQATENLLRIIELVFTLYSPKEHRLTELMNRCKRFTTEIFKAFPRTRRKKNGFSTFCKGLMSNPAIIPISKLPRRTSTRCCRKSNTCATSWNGSAPRRSTTITTLAVTDRQNNGQQ